MKRKFILLPITLTALTPMVSITSCSKSDDVEIKLTKLYTHPDYETNILISTEEPLTFTKGVKYTAIIDMSEFSTLDVDTAGFWVADKFHFPFDDENKSTAITKPNVIVNGEELLEVSEKEDLKVNTFRLLVNLEIERCGIEIGVGTVKKDSISKIEFEVKNPTKKYYPLFQVWKDKKEA